MSDETLTRRFQVDWALAAQERRLIAASEWLLVREAEMDRHKKCRASRDTVLRAKLAWCRARAWSMLAQAVLEAGNGDGGKARLALMEVNRARRESSEVAKRVWGTACK
jgi:hypothetical protein